MCYAELKPQILNNSFIPLYQTSVNGIHLWNFDYFKVQNQKAWLFCENQAFDF